MDGRGLKHKTCELPFDVVDDILTRVPVKDLERFRCVCKRWRSLLQHKKFIAKHISYAPWKFLSVQNSKNWPLSMIYQHDGDGKPEMIWEDTDLTGKAEDLFGMELIGHWNGLFCLWLYDRSLAVWNPSLRELRRMRTMKPPSGSNMVGFGYDPLTDDYKIVVLPANTGLGGNTPQAEILTLKSNPRMIDFSCERNPTLHPSMEKGTLLGRYIFWLGNEAPDELHQFLISFDLVSETFEELPYLPRNLAFRDLLVLKGGLCIVDNFTLGWDMKLVIWSPGEIKDTSSIKCWNKLLALTKSNLGILGEGCFINILQSFSAKDSEIIIRMIVRDDDGGIKLLASNKEDGTYRKVGTRGLICNGKFNDPCEYLETLVSTSGV